MPKDENIRSIVSEIKKDYDNRDILMIASCDYEMAKNSDLNSKYRVMEAHPNSILSQEGLKRRSK